MVKRTGLGSLCLITSRGVSRMCVGAVESELGQVMLAGAYLGGVLRVLEHPPQLGMHKIKYSLNYKHALGTYLIHPCITSLTAKFTKLEH